MSVRLYAKCDVRGCEMTFDDKYTGEHIPLLPPGWMSATKKSGDKWVEFNICPIHQNEFFGTSESK